MVVGVMSDRGKVTCVDCDHGPTTPLRTGRTRTLRSPHGQGTRPSFVGIMIPRTRTGFGTLVPEYVRSYETAQLVGCHCAWRAVVDAGTADSVVIFVRPDKDPCPRSRWRTQQW